MSHTHGTERSNDAPDGRRSTALQAEGAALRRAVLAWAHAQGSRRTDFDGTDHWPPDARPSGTAESRERLAHTGERQIWVACDAAQTALAREVAAYTRTSRQGGMTARQVLVAITAVVREAAAPALPAEAVDAVVHDAGRCCVEAYFGR